MSSTTIKTSADDWDRLRADTAQIDWRWYVTKERALCWINV